MSPLTCSIYAHLEYTINSGKKVREPVLCGLIGRKKRGLQAHHGEPGILDIAREEIFKEKGVFLVSRTGSKGGIYLTTDIKEFRWMRNQRASHLWGEKHAVDAMDEIIHKVETIKQELVPLPEFDEDRYLAEQVELNERDFDRFRERQ